MTMSCLCLSVVGNHCPLSSSRSHRSRPSQFSSSYFSLPAMGRRPPSLRSFAIITLHPIYANISIITSVSRRTINSIGGVDYHQLLACMLWEVPPPPHGKRINQATTLIELLYFLLSIALCLRAFGFLVISFGIFSVRGVHPQELREACTLRAGCSFSPGSRPDVPVVVVLLSRRTCCLTPFISILFHLILCEKQVVAQAT